MPVIALPTPKRWATLRPWSRVAVVRRLYDQRRTAVIELSADLQSAMDLPASDPEKVAKLAKAMVLHRQAVSARDELEVHVAEAETFAAT